MDIKETPKFKAGDWIVAGNGKIYNIVSVGDFYRVRDLDGHEHDFHLRFDYFYRLWDFARDVKKGDIVASGSGEEITVCIVNEVCTGENKKGFSSICDADYIMGFCPKPDYGIAMDKFHPANRKEKEFLARLMVDTSYVFDSEKMEVTNLQFKVGKPITTVNIDIDKLLEEYAKGKKLTACEISAYRDGVEDGIRYLEGKL